MSDLEKAVEEERQRCIECVEVHMHPDEDPIILSLLTRIANLIRSGEKPPPFFDPFADE